MRYRIVGSIMPAVEMQLQAGESIYTQTGGMSWMSDGILMNTNARGGFMKGLGRMFTGESFFMTTYTSQRENAEIAFSSTVPGEILPLDLRKYGSMICQKGAFLCAQEQVTADAVFTKKLSSGLFGGEGFILQELRGNGMAFLEIDGNKVEKDLDPGEVIKVDTGNVVAFETSVSYDIEMVKGGMNMFLGGEGLFMTKLTGPGHVILQTQNFSEFVGRIKQYIPTRND
ncbi:TIGR00266 family protein [Lactonifactor sp. BIOML-A3]|uniref:TIGR00266 family protein n=1 Tax=unclassified Lactonifactor TaxID=2636670 RepID=UPI0012AF2DF1|nr:MULTISPECIES: TIGR00266 family protein [unclassified Lactonifactor]MSA01549.1 TIGR00266 family protein [Lactonifactor sp. BIOML-A5]MSA07895.1 TIGR00266 family protein [Lactonifactor sp. BIOML-A4]MSA12512.1 TIGR00266 family protein [Lactonifactor sp. BIOML-A3]MSA17439.1 TIGR00266 family protein [Lactonifactor sp. BIOML-A2]MSA38086.1 TIGR00266 family protein [Lactonifactor sp. BIOML-A1]